MVLFSYSLAIGVAIGLALVLLSKGPVVLAAHSPVAAQSVYRWGLICFNAAGVCFALGGAVRLSGLVLGVAFALSVHAMVSPRSLG